jgi:hypothetical protein
MTLTNLNTSLRRAEAAVMACRSWGTALAARSLSRYIISPLSYCEEFSQPSKLKDCVCQEEPKQEELAST